MPPRTPAAPEPTRRVPPKAVRWTVAAGALGLAVGLLSWAAGIVPTGIDERPGAAQAACRGWDVATADGSLAITVGTIAEAASAAPDGDAATTDQFRSRLEQPAELLKVLARSASLARDLAMTPRLDQDTYHALRDMGAVLSRLHDATRSGSALDTTSDWVPQYQDTRERVVVTCQPYL